MKITKTPSKIFMDERNKRICELYKKHYDESVSITELYRIISEKTGACQSTIIRVLQSNGLRQGKYSK